VRLCTAVAPAHLIRSPPSRKIQRTCRSNIHFAQAIILLGLNVFSGEHSFKLMLSGKGGSLVENTFDIQIDEKTKKIIFFLEDGKLGFRKESH
jgi:hypothetical protein